MFKKRSRKFRERRKDSGSDNDSKPSSDTEVIADSVVEPLEQISANGSGERNDSPAPCKTKKLKKKKDKKSMPKSSSVLSFQQEEGKHKNFGKICVK